MQFLLARLGSQTAVDGRGSGSGFHFESIPAKASVTWYESWPSQLAAQTGRPTLIVEADSLAAVVPGGIVEVAGSMRPDEQS